MNRLDSVGFTIVILDDTRSHCMLSFKSLEIVIMYSQLANDKFFFKKKTNSYLLYFFEHKKTNYYKTTNRNTLIQSKGGEEKAIDRKAKKLRIQTQAIKQNHILKFKQRKEGNQLKKREKRTIQNGSTQTKQSSYLFFSFSFFLT